jgi:hypothetical protein
MSRIIQLADRSIHLPIRIRVWQATEQLRRLCLALRGIDPWKRARKVSQVTVIGVLRKKYNGGNIRLLSHAKNTGNLYLAGVWIAGDEGDFVLGQLELIRRIEKKHRA